jgi:hypothetical protein
MWIGLNDQLVEGSFVWDHGEPNNWNLFNLGEPNGGTRENCALIVTNSYDGSMYGSWVDSECGGTYSYVCESYSSGY